MSTFVELARAKVNLTLKVRGRRADGYHELESLVAFADAGDVLTLTPGMPPSVTVGGRFATDILGGNILERALSLLRSIEPALKLGAVSLEKRLPVAAGLGGGSADAAALLRAVRRANPEHQGRIDWHGIAVRLGADVPVCLTSAASLMWGIGEKLKPVTLPAVPAVLANPLVEAPADKTARVFRLLEARPLCEPNAADPPGLEPITCVRDLAAVLEAQGNALSAPARQVVPEMASVEAALADLPGAWFRGVSGAGPTCFALFETAELASAAAAGLQREHPSWWVAAVALS